MKEKISRFLTIGEENHGEKTAVNMANSGMMCILYKTFSMNYRSKSMLTTEIIDASMWFMNEKEPFGCGICVQNCPAIVSEEPDVLSPFRRVFWRFESGN